MFRVWAPAAKQAFVFLYGDGDALSEERKAVPMDAEVCIAMLGELGRSPSSLASE